MCISSGRIISKSVATSKAHLLETRPISFAGLAKVSTPSRPGTAGRRGVATAASWRVSNSSLEPIPAEFPLERTSRRIADVDAAVVAARVCACLRMRSVEAEYNDEKAKAKCVTAEDVSFNIKLYAGEGGGVVIEVQRRKGSSFSFMSECRAIMKAAEGEGVETRQSVPCMAGRVCEMACLKGVKV